MGVSIKFHPSVCGYLIFPALYVEETVSPLACAMESLQKPLGQDFMTCLCLPPSALLQWSLFMLVACYLIYYNSTLGLGFRHVMSPALFSYLGLLLCHRVAHSSIWFLGSSLVLWKKKSHFFSFIFWFMFTLKVNSQLLILFFLYILFWLFKIALFSPFLPLCLTFPMSWYFCWNCIKLVHL